MITRRHLLRLLLAAPAAALPLRLSLAYAQDPAWIGRYSPHTFIEWRDDGLWFVRPPFATRMLPTESADTFSFERGWIAGLLGRFVGNESGGISLLIRNAEGVWGEFARSGESYPDLGQESIAQLESALEETMAAARSPGAWLYLQIPGRGLWMGARGWADLANEIPLVPHDRWRIASVTKLFVATVALQLAQEGWLPLDSVVEQWLPNLLPDGAAINIRHLLQHTSGLPEYMTDRFVRGVRAAPERVWQPAELVASALQYRRRFAPGAEGRWAYANTNYILLGMIIEQVTGHTLEQELAARIFAPLGLERTQMAPPRAEAVDLARGYVGGEDYSVINMSFAWAAGGIISTADMTGRFLAALVGGQLLRPETFALMQEFVSAGRNEEYGLGLMRHRLNDQAVIGHTGGLAGYRTVAWHLPSSGITVVAGCNRYQSDPNRIAAAAIRIVV